MERIHIFKEEFIMKKWMDVERVFAITGEVVGLQNKLLSLDLEKREIEFKFN